MSSITRSRQPARKRQPRALRLPCPALAVALLVLICCGAARAQTPPPRGPQPEPGQPNVNPCDVPQGQKRSFDDYFRCAKHYYDKVTSKDGPRLVIGGVAPGGGIGFGAGFGKRGSSESWQYKFDASARVTIRKYWEVDTNLRLTRLSNKPNGCDEWGPSEPRINFYGLFKDMRRLSYYGLGPETREQDRASYHYREPVVGADVSKPNTGSCRVDVGGAVEGIFPSLARVSNPDVRSVERAYTEATAPGVNSARPAYLHLAAYARFHSRGQPEARKLEYLFIYHVYQDVKEHLFSFRRFDADLRHKFPFGDKNELRVRGRLSLSETSPGQRIPFYMMETLGGLNIRGDDTLRGFRDYRFRDRDYALLQAEYLRRLFGPLDFIAFYDTGKVARSVSRFDEGRLRHTYGLGLVVVPRRLDNVLFRLYVALGSGEGMHTYFGGGSGRPDRLVR